MILNPVRIASGGSGVVVGVFTTGANNAHTLSLPFTPAIVIYKDILSNNFDSYVAIYNDSANSWGQNTVTLKGLTKSTSFAYCAIPKSD